MYCHLAPDRSELHAAKQGRFAHSGRAVENGAREFT